MKKIIAIIYIGILSIGMGFAQENYLEYASKVIPPSPTSSVFKRFGNHTPSLATGAIDIPIPLYELKVDNFTLPFTLQYNTSGINVMDIPFPTGYGWTLTPGLRVTRTVMGRSDDHFPFRALSGSENFYTIKCGIFEINGSTHGILQKDLFDTQKDIFTVHLPSGNYNFLITKKGDTYEAFSIGNLLKIEFFIHKKSIVKDLSARINGFKITDENGIIYIFGMDETEDLENSYIESPGSKMSNGITTWVLREIVLLNNTKVNFTWKKILFDHSIYSPRSENPIVIKDNKSTDCDNNPNPEEEYIGGYNDMTPYKEVCLLDKVDFQVGTIKLNYKSDKEPFITTFEVKDKNNTAIRTVNFSYGTGSGSYLLEKLKIDNEIYKFNYNTIHFYKNTTALDYWGYYNGKVKNVSLIPLIRPNLYAAFSGMPSTPKPYGNYGFADRNPDDENMQAFMLKRIDYPTGGYSEFTYEPHQFEDQYPTSKEALDSYSTTRLYKGGGLRVSQITTRADNASVPIIKKYKYGNAEKGLGNIEYAPTLDTFVDEYQIYEELPCDDIHLSHMTSRRLFINSFSSVNRHIIYDRPVWYDIVTEYINDNKTVYTFQNESSTKSYYRQANLFFRLFTYNCNNLFDGGPRVANQTIYIKNTTNYIPIEETIYTYKRNATVGFQNNLIERRTINGFRGQSSPDFDHRDPLFSNANFHDIYNFLPYSTRGVHYTLTNKKVISYSNTNQVVDTEEYIYNDINGFNSQISKVTKINSNGAKRVVEYKYPNNYTDLIYKEMINKNIRSPRIEEIVYNNEGKEISRVRTNYTNSPSIANGLLLPISQENSFEGTSKLLPQITFNKYDYRGNLVQFTTFDNINTVILWGYTGQYPIAKIHNATYAQILSIINETTLASISVKFEPTISDLQTINTLRNHTSIKDAHITTYTYKPLVGMLTSTDPSGIITYYDYDSFGRLKETYIIEGGVKKIVQSYNYNYKNK